MLGNILGRLMVIFLTFFSATFIMVATHELAHLLCAMIFDYFIEEVIIGTWAIKYNKQRRKIEIHCIKFMTLGECRAFPKTLTKKSRLKWCLYLFTGPLMDLSWFVICCVLSCLTWNIMTGTVLLVSMINLAEILIYNPESESKVTDMSLIRGMIKHEKWTELIFLFNVFVGMNLSGKRPRELPKEMIQMNNMEMLEDIYLDKVACYSIILTYYYLDQHNFEKARIIFNKYILPFYKEKEVPVQIQALNLFFISYLEKDSSKAEKLLNQALLDNKEDYEVQLAKVSYYKLIHDDSMNELVAGINQKRNLPGSDKMFVEIISKIIN